MTTHSRFLGFAFASADFLFEVDAQGVVQFCAGALAGVSSEDVRGQPASTLFDGASAALLAKHLKELPAGERRGPVPLKTATGRDVHLSLFRLPENGAHASCTLSRPPGASAEKRDAATGLETRDGLLDATALAG